jgi:hypothetical protein
VHQRIVVEIQVPQKGARRTAPAKQLARDRTITNGQAALGE